MHICMHVCKKFMQQYAWFHMVVWRLNKIMMMMSLMMMMMINDMPHVYNIYIYIHMILYAFNEHIHLRN